MRPTRSIVRMLASAAGACALLVPGCSSPDSGSKAEPAVSVSPTVLKVKVQSVPGTGKILVDTRGRALYVNDVETKGAPIKCTGECATEWPPHLVATTSVPSKLPGVKGTFSVVKRPNGAKQLALGGQPLYTFDQDRSAGMVRGNGFVDNGSGTKIVWHVARPEG